MAGNRKFESISLQRRVVCEPEDDIDIPVPRGSTITRCIAIVALARKLLIGLSRYVTVPMFRKRLYIPRQAAARNWGDDLTGHYILVGKRGPPRP